MIKDLQRRYTVPRPRLLWTPASCGGGCRWKGLRDSGGSPPHTAHPTQGRICRNQTPRQYPRFSPAEYRRLYFLDCGLSLRESVFYQSRFIPLLSAVLESNYISSCAFVRGNFSAQQSAQSFFLLKQLSCCHIVYSST